MLFKVIYHKRKPCKASETFDRGIWTAILISETSNVVSGTLFRSGRVQVLERFWDPAPHDLVQEDHLLQSDQPPFTVCIKRKVSGTIPDKKQTYCSKISH